MTAEHSSEEGGEGLSEAERESVARALVSDESGDVEPALPELLALVDLAAPSIERILADRLAAVQAERDGAVEALDNYLSDPPLPIGNDVIADAQEMAAMLADENRHAAKEIERLRERLTYSDEAIESAEAECDDLRGRLAAVADEFASRGDRQLAETGTSVAGMIRAALANPSAAQGEGEVHELLAGARCACGAEHDRRGSGESGTDWYARHLATSAPEADQ